MDFRSTAIRHSLDVAPAACTCEIELRSTRSGGPGPLDISINLPDTILGLENLALPQQASTYRGCLFQYHGRGAQLQSFRLFRQLQGLLPLSWLVTLQTQSVHWLPPT